MVGFEDKNYLTDEDRWTLVYNLTEEKKIIIKCDFILNNFSGNYTAVMLLGYAEQHAPCPSGDEKYTYFNLTPRPRRNGKNRYCQYEWRDPTSGELFSCVAPTLEKCREKRYKWLIDQK